MNHQIDPVLKSLVVAVEGGYTPFPITLHVGGTLVEGTVVAYSVYLVEFGHLLENEYVEQSGEETPEKVAEMVENISSIFGQFRNVEVPDPQFINLKDVRIYSPNANTLEFEQPKHPYWRFALEDVSGWTLGRTAI